MRGAFAPRDRAVLVKSPNVRQQAARRRAALACGVLALALASGLIGSLVHPHREALGGIHTGPFSYFPSE